MFSKNMPYYEILEALKNVSDASALADFDKICLRSSLKNPFVRALLKMYPAPASTRKILDVVLTQKTRVIDLNVHNGGLSHHRARTKDYLFKRYPSEVTPQLIEELQVFINLQLENPEVINELIIAHRQRQLEAQTVLDAAQMSQEIAEIIIADFKDYLEHLKNLFAAHSIFAWGVLACLLKRLSSLEGPSLLQSQIEFMRALDDSRTAYFGKTRKFLLNGKDYSCSEGLEERCLDHHAYLVPTAKTRTYEKAIMQLIDPFLQQIKDQHGFFRGYTCSNLLMHIYAQAAGYHIVRTKNVEFRFGPTVTDEALSVLKAQYLAENFVHNIEKIQALMCLKGIDILSLDTDARALRTHIMHENLVINTLITIIKENHASYNSEQVPLFIQFLQKRAGETFIKESLSLTDNIEFIVPTVERTDEEIIEAMLDIGPFVDKSHLLTVLAVIPLSQIKELLQIDPSVLEIRESDFSKDDALSAYKLAKISLENLYRNYYDMYLPEMDDAFFSKESLRAPICSEEVFLQFLSKQKEYFQSHPKICNKLTLYAILCLKNGYRRALRELIVNFRVSPNLISSQEDYNLLQLACNERDIETVKVILDLGGRVVAGSLRFRLPATHIAIKNGDLNILRELLNHGVDINQKSSLSDETPLIYAIQSAQFAIAKMLVLSGADLTLSTVDSYTPLMWFASKNFAKNRAAAEFLDCLFSSYQGNEQELQHMINITCMGKLSMTLQPRQQRISALHIAIVKHNLSLIKRLVHAGANLWKELQVGGLIETLGRYADLEVMKYFLKNNHVTLTERDLNGQTLMDVAIVADKVQLVALLFFYQYPDAKTESSNEQFRRVWFKAVHASAIHLMIALKNKDPSVLELADEQGKTAFMHHMANPCFNDMVVKIYNHAPHFARKDNEGNSALVLAAQSEHDHDFGLIYYLAENLKKNTTAQDFQDQWDIAVSLAYSKKKTRSFIALATYFEKELLEKTLPELLSEGDAAYTTLMQLFKGRECEVLATLVFQLLRFDSKNVLPRRDFQEFVEKLVFEIISVIVMRVDHNENFSNIQNELLVRSFLIILGRGKVPEKAVEGSHSVGLEPNIGWSLRCVPSTLHIINVALHLPTNKLRALWHQLEYGYLSFYSDVVISLFCNREFQRETEKAFRDCARIILNKIRINNPDSLRDEELALLQQIHRTNNILTFAVEEGYGVDLIYFLLTKVCFISNAQEYQEIAAGAKVAAQLKNKKSIEMLLNVYFYQFAIKQYIQAANAENFSEILGTVESRLKQTLKERAASQSLIPLLALFSNFFGNQGKDLLLILVRRGFESIDADLNATTAEHLTEDDYVLIRLAVDIVINNKEHNAHYVQNYQLVEHVVLNAILLRETLERKTLLRTVEPAAVMFRRERVISFESLEQAIAKKVFGFSKNNK